MKKRQILMGIFLMASLVLASPVVAEETSLPSTSTSSTSVSTTSTSSSSAGDAVSSSTEPSIDPVVDNSSTTAEVPEQTTESSSQAPQANEPTQPATEEVVDEAAQVEVPIYRLYHPGNGEHLYTTDAGEKDSLYAAGWGYEGIAWYSPSKGQPVYRLYNAGLQNHLYTTDTNEVRELTSRHGWVSDNNGAPVFYSGGTVSIYRLYNPALRGLHHWTTDRNEYGILPAHGWSQEGMKFQAARLGNPVQTRYAYVEAFAGQFQLSGDFELPGGVKKQLVDTILQFQSTGYHMGFIMMDVHTQRSIAYNADQRFYAASTIKGPFIASLAAKRPDLIGSERWAMQSVLYYSSNEQYIRLALTYGMSTLSAWAQESAVRPDVATYYPYYSARELFQLWKRNYVYFTLDPQGQQVGLWFENANQSPIRSVLGSQYRVRSKAGWIGEPGYHSASDAGIVYAKAGPYIIAILTDADAKLPMLNPTVSVLNTLVGTLDQVQTEMAQAQ